MALDIMNGYRAELQSSLRDLQSQIILSVRVQVAGQEAVQKPSVLERSSSERRVDALATSFLEEGASFKIYSNNTKKTVWLYYLRGKGCGSLVLKKKRGAFSLSSVPLTSTVSLDGLRKMIFGKKSKVIAQPQTQTEMPAKDLC